MCNMYIYNICMYNYKYVYIIIWTYDYICGLYIMYVQLCMYVCTCKLYIIIFYIIDDVRIYNYMDV